MGLRRTGMSRFEKLVTTSMEYLFPGEVTISEVAYEAACSGGRVFRDFDEHGLPVNRRMRTVRVRKELLETPPAIGARITWTPADGDPVTLRVVGRPERPHEAAWALVCEQP